MKLLEDKTVNAPKVKVKMNSFDIFRFTCAGLIGIFFMLFSLGLVLNAYTLRFIGIYGALFSSAIGLIGSILKLEKTPRL